MSRERRTDFPFGEPKEKPVRRADVVSSLLLAEPKAGEEEQQPRPDHGRHQGDPEDGEQAHAEHLILRHVAHAAVVLVPRFTNEHVHRMTLPELRITGLSGGR